MISVVISETEEGAVWLVQLTTGGDQDDCLGDDVGRFGEAVC
jgi:hypothetical protein